MFGDSRNLMPTFKVGQSNFSRRRQSPGKIASRIEFQSEETVCTNDVNRARCSWPRQRTTSVLFDTKFWMHLDIYTKFLNYILYIKSKIVLMNFFENDVEISLRLIKARVHFNIVVLCKLCLCIFSVL